MTRPFDGATASPNDSSPSIDVLTARDPTQVLSDGPSGDAWETSPADVDAGTAIDATPPEAGVTPDSPLDGPDVDAASCVHGCVDPSQGHVCVDWCRNDAGSGWCASCASYCVNAGVCITCPSGYTFCAPP